jgi:bifunctional UDP-N-acetylglucosamine pyrophosphorylase/glucosamine-1-phosphate N-acetyltransferase
MFGIILAAGKGTRMKSILSKVLHKVNDIPMILITVRKLLEMECMEKILIVVGDNRDKIDRLMAENLSSAEYTKLVFILQKEQLGTGHAVMVCKDYLARFPAEHSLILFADLPLIEPATLNAMSQEGRGHGCLLAICHSENPAGCGRIILEDNIITGSVEEKDCSDEQKLIKLINAGIYTIHNQLIIKYIDDIKNNNAQKEYYLPDILHILIANDHPITPYYIENTTEILNVNTPEQLAAAVASATSGGCCD